MKSNIVCYEKQLNVTDTDIIRRIGTYEAV